MIYRFIIDPLVSWFIRILDRLDSALDVFGDDEDYDECNEYDCYECDEQGGPCDNHVFLADEDLYW